MMALCWNIPIDWIGLDNQFISTEFKSGVKFKIFVLLIESKVQSNGERGDGRDAELFVGLDHVVLGRGAI